MNEPTNNVDRHDGGTTDKYRIHALESVTDELVKRVAFVEGAMTDGRVTFAEMKKDMHAMKESLDKVQAVLSRLNWTVILAVLGALLALVIKGHAS